MPAMSEANRSHPSGGALAPVLVTHAAQLGHGARPQAAPEDLLPPLAATTYVAAIGRWTSLRAGLVGYACSTTGCGCRMCRRRPGPRSTTRP